MSITLNHISSILESHGNPAYADSMRAYLKNNFDFIGLKTPIRREITKEVIAESRKLPLDELVDLIDHLWDQDYREYQMLGLDIMIKNKEKFHHEDIPAVMNWLVQESWWDTVDMIASNVVGDIARRYPEARDQYLEEWILADNMWLNRTCLIFQLKYKEEVDLKRLFRYIGILNSDSRFFIQKAIGWSLRQASKCYPQEIRTFIDSQELSKLANREGTKYIS
jgi:3-methyladenine DNA glycosylase AlkD